MEEIVWKSVHTTDIPVRWCDMDAFGHVNNSVFFSYFESARIDWWTTITPDHLDFQDSGPVLINANCTFLKPVFYPELLVVEVLVGPAGRSSYECRYLISSKKDPSIRYAEGSTKVVWVDRIANRSIELPDYIRQHLPTK